MGLLRPVLRTEGPEGESVQKDDFVNEKLTALMI